MNLQEFLAELKSLITGGKTLKAAQDENATLSSKILNLETENLELRTKAQETKTKLEEANNQISQLTQERDSLKQKVDNQPKEVARQAAVTVSKATDEPVSTGDEVVNPTVKADSFQEQWEAVRKDPKKKVDFIRENRKQVKEFLNKK